MTHDVNSRPMSSDTGSPSSMPRSSSQSIDLNNVVLGPRSRTQPESYDIMAYFGPLDEALDEYQTQRTKKNNIRRVVEFIDDPAISRWKTHLSTLHTQRVQLMAAELAFFITCATERCAANAVDENLANGGAEQDLNQFQRLRDKLQTTAEECQKQRDVGSELHVK